MNSVLSFLDLLWSLAFPVQEPIFLVDITAPTDASAALAPSLTRGCDAVSACSVSAGTTCGSVFASCLGAQYAIDPSSSTAACLVRHFSSSSERSSAGSTCRQGGAEVQRRCSGGAREVPGRCRGGAGAAQRSERRGAAPGQIGGDCAPS